ncbi:MULTISPECIES: hypothetical protein [Nocardioides]|uniref:Septum formation-related domain-containing protein n=1 Tax=Nocardioides vastitatis TaxID=2568655 RepID=A0ABW0ZHW0_9ACTN|nr:hypothetical protein [Nocardioides sp.]THI93263.1 hypothetical protein E7Z54_21075 [Nocardioides sp.]
MIGIVGSISLVGALVGLVWLGNSLVLEDEARVSQCVDTRTVFDSVDLWEADCGEPHDAEIVAVGEFDGDLISRYDAASVEDFCIEVTTEDRYRPLLRSGEYDVAVSTDALDDDDPEFGDHFACFLERSDGEQLTGPVG